MHDVVTTVWGACKRRSSRHRILHSEGEAVEFRLADGTTGSFPLLDISVDGLSFALASGAPTVEPGMRLRDAVVRLGDRRIHGDVSIAHVTHAFAAGVVCGARFRPRSEVDKRELERFLAAADLSD